MTQAIQATEFFGLVVVLVILYGSVFETKQKNAKTKAFEYLCAGVFFTVLSDAVTWFPYTAKTEWLLYVTTFLAFVLPYVVNALFLNYLYVTVKMNREVPRTLFTFGIIYSLVMVFALLAFAINGSLFKVINGAFVEGPLFDVYLLTYLILLGYILLIICKHFSMIGIHDSVAALLFLIIPVIFITCNFFWSDFAFSIASLPIAVLVINTMLQAERENSLIQMEKATRVRAHKDELTNLPNRLEYNERISKMSGYYRIGVLFCDLNGLKYTNDNYGHAAGDKLLCDFSDAAREFFKETDIFRISGDEFVIFMPRVAEAEFQNHVEKFIKRISAFEYPISSVGSAYGNQSEIKNLLDLAEKKMYENKKEFHLNYPQFTRDIG